MMEMNGRVALVTGASGGLGSEIARSLAARGTDLVLTYNNNAKAARDLAAELEPKGVKVRLLKYDAGDFAGIEQFITELQTVLGNAWGMEGFDFLVNNAGIGGHHPVGSITEEQFDRLMSIQFKGPVLLIERLISMINNGGRIINITTGLTRFSIPGFGAYAAMKGAIEVYTRYLARELGERGIAVNAVAPGAIDNEFNRRSFQANPAMKETLAAQTALGRVGRSDDIGGVVAFLCSDDARWVTAQRLEISGGMFV